MAALIYTSVEHAASALQEDAKGREALTLLKGKRLLRHAPAAHPVVVLEGLDGTGKSTLSDGLLRQLGQQAASLRSPPREMLHLRPYFDAQPPALRRAFYSLGNYACAMEMRRMAEEGPVVVDRFWPSTAAYALSLDHQVMPEDMPDALKMPRDLVELLPSSTTFLLLELPEEERARRVRARAGTGAIEEEEVQLERSRQHRQRLHAAYHALSIDGEALTVCDASGTQEEVLARALCIVEQHRARRAAAVPISVNWHMTRQCNYSCKFCFHTAKTSVFLPRTREGMIESKRCLAKLKAAGMLKLNFSGGEPFLQAKELGELCRFCKEDLELESVSIISNGSKISKAWVKQYGRFVDVLAVSCDSFSEEANKLIGRGRGMHIEQLERVRAWCREFGVPFKLNSVINAHNVDEDMTDAITRLDPIRWKVFQCLLLAGENTGEGALRDAEPLVITNEQFSAFVQRHRALKCLVPEDNAKMRDSYLILDEELRFLNCTGGAKTPSRSLRGVSVTAALQEAGFDREAFHSRGGIYAWARPRAQEVEDLAVDRQVTASPRSRPPQHQAPSPTKKQCQPPPGQSDIGALTSRQQLLMLCAATSLAVVAVLRVWGQAGHKRAV